MNFHNFSFIFQDKILIQLSFFTFYLLLNVASHFVQILFKVALFWYQLFWNNEDFLYFMLTGQRLNGVSKARRLAHLQLQ